MQGKSIGHILVVDDQENWRLLLSSLLGNDGHTVRTAGSFEDAIEMLSQEEFDIIVLDVRLADVDILNVEGIELLRLIRSRKPTSRVVMLTGYPQAIRSGVLEKYGADALLLKVPHGSMFDSRGFRKLICDLLLH